MRTAFNIIKLMLLSAFSSLEKKHQARHSLLTFWGTRWGIRIYNKDLNWFRDQDYLNIWRGFALSDNKIHERRYNLFYISRSVASIAGDTAECGSFYGGGSYLIMKAANPGMHHIFDSFEGLSRPEAVDISNDKKFRAWRPNDLSVPEDHLKGNLVGAGLFKTYKGWIPERFNEVSDQSFKLVHIDVDLFQPTIDSLRFFYQRLVCGGIIVCDDFGFETCPGAFQACIEFEAEVGRKFIRLTTGQSMLVK